MSDGADALDILAESGQWRIEPGLSPAELTAVQRRFDLSFSPEYREFLAAGLPVGSGWPDWRNADETPLLATDLGGARWLDDQFRERAEDISRAEVLFQPVGGNTWRQSFAAFDHDHEYLTLALIPTPASWLVPGLLQWSGAVNHDVRGVHHAAMLCRWADRYGAELVALDAEYLVLHVSTPPRDERSALTAAVEAWLYCEDAVNTQAGSVDALAMMLTDELWTFWWD